MTGEYLQMGLFVLLEISLVLDIVEGLVQGKIMHPFWWSMKYLDKNQNPAAYLLSLLMYCTWAVVIAYYLLSGVFRVL